MRRGPATPYATSRAFSADARIIKGITMEYLHGVDLHMAQRNRSTVKIEVDDGETVEGRIVAFDDWHLLIQLKDFPCVVLVAAIARMEQLS
jgi:hypothetical protein